MDLGLNNRQKLICHKAQQTKPQKCVFKFFSVTFFSIYIQFNKFFTVDFDPIR